VYHRGAQAKSEDFPWSSPEVIEKLPFLVCFFSLSELDQLAGCLNGF
jgi:hypothetical protein